VVRHSFGTLILRRCCPRCATSPASPGSPSVAASPAPRPTSALSQPAISQAIGRWSAASGSVCSSGRAGRCGRRRPGGRSSRTPEALLDAAAALTAEATRQATPSIAFAYPPLVGALAARIARRLAHRSPAIDLDLRPSGWTAANAALHSGDVPVAIMSLPFPPGLPTRPASRCRWRTSPSRPATRWPGAPPPAPTTCAARGAAAAHAAAGQHLGAPRGRCCPGTATPGPTSTTSPPPSTWWPPAPACCPRRACSRDDPRHDVRFVPFDAGDLRITYGLVWQPDTASAEVMAVVSTVQEALRTR
jgi:hypothetical protein